MLVNCYFVLDIEPELEPGQVEQLFRLTAGNVNYPVGADYNGRRLYRAIVDSALIAGAFDQLHALGKDPSIVGVFDQSGAKAAGFEHFYNPSERFLHFPVISAPDEEIAFPPDNTAAGWELPPWD